MATWQARAGRAGACLLVLGATVAGPTLPARAADAVKVTPTLLQSNWYWHHATTDAPVVVPGEVPSEPSNVPDGDLPVASLNGQGARSKVSVLAFGLPDAGAGTSVSDFSVTLKVDASATNIQLEPPKLVAGLCLRDWMNGKGGDQDTVNAPPVDETGLVPGTWSADGTSITFKAPAIAQSWFDDQNFGLELLPAPDYTTPFQVSFSGKDVTSALTYTPPLSLPEGPLVTEPGTGGTGGTGTAGPPVASGGFPSGVGGPIVPGPPPSVDQGPVTPAPTTVLPAAQALPEVSSRPSAGLFWGALGILALLVLLSLVLGGRPETSAGNRASRLTTVLQSRRTLTSSYSVPA